MTDLVGSHNRGSDSLDNENASVIHSVVSNSCHAMDCSLPGPSTAYGILQARIPEWVAISSSRGSSRPSDRTHGTCIGRRLGRDLGKSLGALTAMGNSVVMRHQVKKPRGQSSLCAFPRLPLLG